MSSAEHPDGLPTGTVVGPAEPRGRRWPKVVAGVAAALVLVTATLGAGVALLGRRLEGNVTALDVSAALGTRPAQGSTSAMNILLMGSDTRAGQGGEYGSAKVYDTARSDTTILLHLSADRSRALAVSIPRDSWVPIPACTLPDGTTTAAREGKFNSAFERGGPSCTIKTVESLTGVYLDHFAVVDFTGFKTMVDAVGGVEVCVPEAVDDPKSGLVLPRGKSVVTGEQALAFVRARKTLGDGSDISRIGRQQDFISSLVRKATSLGVITNPLTLYRTLDAATSSLTVDPGLSSLKAMKDLALSVKDITPEQITFVTVPWVERGDGENVLWYAPKADELWSAVKADAAYPPKPSIAADGKPLTSRPTDIRVRVVNATGTPGRAKTVAAALAAQGYVVEGVSTASAPAATSHVEFDPAFDESARTLAFSASGARAVATPGQGRVLTLVVGTDFAGVVPVVTSAVPGTSPSPARTAAGSVCAR